MANYDVDIEIALRGADKLKNLQSDLRAVTRHVGKVNAATIKLNKALGENFSRKNIANVNNYSNAVRRAERALRNAAAGTDAEKRAVSALVTAQKEYNAQLDRQNKLIEEEKRAQGIPTSAKRRPLAAPGATGNNQVSFRSSLASPVLGARNIAGSPMATAFGFEPSGSEGGRAKPSRFGSAVQAGAFPLLFGGGPAQALGGALGGFMTQDIFGPATVGLQVAGGFIDQTVSSLGDLGRALESGKNVVTAYEAAVGRLSEGKKEYLNALEQSGQKQKLYNEITKQASKDLGFLGDLLIINAENAATFDSALGSLANAAKSLAAAPFIFLGAETFGGVNPMQQQDKLTQAAKDRVNAAREETATVGLTLQTKQKQFALDSKLTERNIEALAAAQTAEIVDEKRLAIAKAESDLMKGLITKSEKDLEITKATEQAEKKLLGVERQRLSNAEKLQQKKDQIARDAARAAVENLQFDTEQTKESTKALKLQDQLRHQINMQIVDEQVNRTAILNGEKAGLQEALALADRRHKAEQGLLTIENASIRVALTGHATEREINQIIQTRNELLHRNTLARKAELENALTQLQIEKDINTLRAGQETAGISTDLTRAIEDTQFNIANPFNTEDSEMLDLRINQIRRLEDAESDLNAKIKEQDILLRSGTAEQKQKAAEQKQRLQDRLNLYRALLPQLDAVEQAELRQQQILERVQPIADAVASGVMNIFTSIADGSKDAKEAFADMLKAVAAALAQQAAVMIAQYIAIGIARIFAGIPGVGENTFSGKGAGSVTGKTFSTTMSGLAEGGYVDKPTTALIGEGGEPEFVIPQSKMRESMARFNAGARGSNVIPAEGGGSYSSPAGSTGTVVNYNGPTLSFNSEDYVPVSAVDGIINEAAKRGAKAGESRTFASLQNSRSRRSRIGLGR